MSAFPKAPEDLEADRRAAEALAAGVYLSAPELSMLRELELGEGDRIPMPADVRGRLAIAKYLPSHGERLAKVERLADLGLVTFKTTAAELTPWGRFIAGVRRGQHG
ncbi:MAG: hypothetical protein ACRBN8_22615 [Nannocystales bacterium]